MFLHLLIFNTDYGSICLNLLTRTAVIWVQL